MKLHVCVLVLILGIVIKQSSGVHLTGGRRHGYPSYGQRSPMFGNFRVRRQSPTLGGFRSPRLRLSRFPGFGPRSRISPFMGLRQRNPFATSFGAGQFGGRQFGGGQFGAGQFGGGLRSSFLRSSPMMSEFSRPNTNRLRQRGLSVRRLGLTSGTRGGLGSFGTSIGRPSRFRTLSRGQRLSSTDMQQLRQLSRGLTGTGTRDDPIRIRSSLPGSRLAPGSVRRISQRTQTSSSLVPSSDHPAGADPGVIALFGFEEALRGTGSGGHILDDHLPILSETVDLPVGVQRTPIKKSATKTKTVAKSDKITQTSELEKIERIEKIVRDGAASVIKSEKKLLTATQSEVLGKLDKVVAHEEVVAHTVGEVTAHAQPDVVGDVITHTEAEVIAHVPEEVTAKGLKKVVANVATEIVEAHPIDLVQESPLHVIEGIPLAVEGVISETPVEVSAEPTITVDAAIKDADTVNVNINATVTTNNTVIAESPVAIEPEPVKHSQVAEATTLVEPLAVYVEGHAVPDLHHVSSNTEQAISHQLADVAAHVDAGGVVIDAPIDVAGTLHHDVGGVSVIADTKASTQSIHADSIIAAVDAASVKDATHTVTDTAHVNTNSNNENFNTNEIIAL